VREVGSVGVSKLVQSVRSWSGLQVFVLSLKG
jgi:hypothetical protein